MKRLFRVLLILSVMLTVLVVPASAKADKVDVCHKGKTISVSVNAEAAHLAHGDSEGACD